MFVVDENLRYCVMFVGFCEYVFVFLRNDFEVVFFLMCDVFFVK